MAQFESFDTLYTFKFLLRVAPSRNVAQIWPGFAGTPAFWQRGCFCQDATAFVALDVLNVLNVLNPSTCNHY